MNGLNIAKRKANESTFQRAKIGAVITKGGRVLASACNQTRYSRLTGKNWTSIHAEEQAIYRVLNAPNGLRKLAGSTLYVTRIKKDGTTGLAKPCNKCQQLINSVGIKKVIHT